MTTKKSPAIRTLEKMRGGRLTFGRMIESIRKSDEISKVELAHKMKFSKHIYVILKKAEGLLHFLAPSYSPRFWATQFAAKAIEDQVYEAGFKVKVTLSAA